MTNLVERLLHNKGRQLQKERKRFTIITTFSCSTFIDFKQLQAVNDEGVNGGINLHALKFVCNQVVKTWHLPYCLNFCKLYLA